MLLIDGTNLHAGGGRALFLYLLDRMAGRNFKAIASNRLELTPSENIEVKPWVNPLSSQRQAFLEEAVKRLKPKRVFCFGNIPPRRVLNNCETITFFQNAHLLKSIDKFCRYSLKNKTRYFLLRRAVKNFSKNTDSWIFQSDYIRSCFEKEYGVTTESADVVPFFDEQHLRKTCDQITTSGPRKGFVYVSDGQPHKNHKRLLDAWEMLPERFGLNPELHLTIPSESESLIQRIATLKAKGLNVINHGRLPRERALELTAQCKFAIFPSLLETLGLGLVEGCLLGNLVIAPKNPALEEILVPSAVVDPLDSLSISDVVATACKTELSASKILVQDKIDLLLKRLYTE